MPGTRELVVPDTPYVIPYRVRGEYVGPGNSHPAIYQIRDEALLILVVMVGDRKEVYRRVK